MLACLGLLTGLVLLSDISSAENYPDTVTDLQVSERDQPIYRSSGYSYLKAGESYNLSGTGPTTHADPDLTRIDFFALDRIYKPERFLLGSFSGEELNSSEDTKNYVLEFEAKADHLYFLAISYNSAGNSSSYILDSVKTDGKGPHTPYGMEVEGNGDDLVALSGWVRDELVEGRTSGVCYVYTHVNDEVLKHDTDGSYEWLDDEPYKAGDMMKVQVEDNRFQLEFPLTPIDTSAGDLRNIVQVQGVDNVGNLGGKSNISGIPALWVLDPEKSKNVEMTEEAFGITSGIDQVGDISVSFIKFAPGDLNYHTIQMGYHPEVPDVDESAMVMVGYWTVTTDVTGDFVAKVTIYFNHPSFSAFDFYKLTVVAKHNEESDWETLGDANFFYLPANPAANRPEPIYGAEFAIDQFSDFAIIQGKPDLQISDTHIYANPLVEGQTVKIAATVRNVGELSPTAEDVDVLVYYTDSEGTHTTIGVINLGDVAPGKDNEVTGSLEWETPDILDSSKEPFYIYFKVDPNGTISEYNETNNNAFLDELLDGNADPVEILRTQALVPWPQVEEPANSSTVSKTVNITGHVAMMKLNSLVAHTHGYSLGLVVEHELSLSVAKYELRDFQSQAVPGFKGYVRDIYGLQIEDEGVNISFEDNDRDGNISSGDTFFLKGIDQGGPATLASKLWLFARADKIEVSVDDGSWVSVSGSSPSSSLWNHLWDSTTVTNGDHSLAFRCSAGGDVSVVSYLNLNVVNEKPDDEPGFLPGFELLAFPLAALPAVVWYTRKKQKT